MGEKPERKLGLICGAGRLPLYLAEALRQKGYELLAFTPENKLEPGLERYVEELQVFKFVRLAQLLKLLEEKGTKNIIFAGKFEKKWLYEPDTEIDQLAKAILSQLPDLQDDTIMNAVIEEFERRGYRVFSTLDFIKDWLAPSGVMGAHQPEPKEEQDIKFGFRLAKEIGRLGIGQTVAVLNQAVLAVEAIEGTDLTILRAGQFTAGAVIVKVLRPGQSPRFDLPVVGKSTVQSMVQARARVLAVEAERCLIVEREEMLRLADENGIVIIGVRDGGG